MTDDDLNTIMDFYSIQQRYGEKKRQPFSYGNCEMFNKRPFSLTRATLNFLMIR